MGRAHASLARIADAVMIPVALGILRSSKLQVELAALRIDREHARSSAFRNQNYVTLLGGRVDALAVQRVVDIAVLGAIFGAIGFHCVEIQGTNLPLLGSKEGNPV